MGALAGMLKGAFKDLAADYSNVQQVALNKTIMNPQSPIAQAKKLLDETIGKGEK